MIENDKGYEATQRHLQELRDWRDQSLHQKERDPLEIHMVVAGIEGMIDKLEKEIDEYEARRQTAVTSTFGASL